MYYYYYYFPQCKQLFIYKYIYKGKRKRQISSLSIEMGGLGIDNLTIKNCALLAQWGWRFLTEKDALCRQVLASKF